LKGTSLYKLKLKITNIWEFVIININLFNLLSSNYIVQNSSPTVMNPFHIIWH